MPSFQEKKEKREKGFIRQINTKKIRREKAERAGKITLIYGLGMIGLVGWSIAIPTLLGIALGTWMDAKVPGTHSWTLTMLFIGLTLGCLNAWFWVKAMLKIRKAKRDA